MPVTRFPDDFVLNPPATLEQINSAEKALGRRLPTEYRAFLSDADGGEGPLGEESYLILWPTGDLATHNQGYKVDPEYAPDLILIGTDGGIEVFALREFDGVFVGGPLDRDGPEAVQVRGSTLDEFIASFR